MDEAPAQPALDPARADAARLLGHVHDALVVLLIVLRPLCWDGQPGQSADIAWQVLAGIALLLVAIERLGGLAGEWRWSWRGVLGLALVAALLPSALAAPEATAAWCRWTGWAACLGAAAYLVQVVPGQRSRLAIAALLAGLGLQAVLAVMQKVWVLPTMAAAQANGDEAFAGLGAASGDLAERIANGGVYTTFTLGNQLGAWLALVLPLAVGVTVRFIDPRVMLSPARLVSGALVGAAGIVVFSLRLLHPTWCQAWLQAWGTGVLALVAALTLSGIAIIWIRGWRGGLLAGAVIAGAIALVFADAKGAFLALAVGAAVAWWVALPGRWWRWLPLPAALLAVALGWRSHVFDASVQVRTGYWRAAVAMVREEPWRGHGLDAFAVHYPRLMRPGDEPTRFVHDEPLEAAVAGGAWLGLLALAGILALAWPRRTSAVAAEPGGEREVAGAVPWVLLLAIPYLCIVFAALDGNLGWLPGVYGAAGRDGLAAKAGWALLLGVVAAGLCDLLRRLPPPPAWAWAAALASCAIGPLIDFDLHAAGYLGTALAVACVAPGAWRTLRGGAATAVAVAAAIAVLGLVLSAGIAGRRQVAADETVALLAAARSDRNAARALAESLDADPERPAELAERARDRAWELAEGSTASRLGVLQLCPPSPEATARAEELAAAAPSSVVVAQHLARRLLGEHRWAEAAAQAERAAALAPTTPRMLLAAAEVLERVAAEVPGGDAAARAAALRAEAARLIPLVDPRLRETGAGSTVSP